MQKIFKNDKTPTHLTSFPSTDMPLVYVEVFIIDFYTN